ncbi:RipA family octameric membrane protein [Acinetobacter amyesii]|uniref:RipA family octameric membrane protein n=1 Tax=Acinetobacter amyesii TaxID=2942470 RepID=UPI003F00AA91
MKIFIACSHSDEKLVALKLNELNTISEKKSVQIIRENTLSNNWKKNAKEKIELCDFFVLILGPTDVFANPNIQWEIEQAKYFTTPIYGLELGSVNKSDKFASFKKEYTCFALSEQLLDCLTYENEIIQKNILESYKILVTSSEKVTEQRSKVHTLFITLLTVILSLAIAFVQKQGIDHYSLILMFFVSIIIILITVLWEKMIESYGKLNNAKFEIINSLEKKLRVNNFDKEWEYLEKKDYLTTTSLEKNLVHAIRIITFGIIILTWLFFIFQ